MINKKEFMTSDLPLSAYLLTQDHTLIRVDRAGRQGVFVFPKTAVQRDSVKYLSGDALVNPAEFNLAVRRLKAKLDEALEPGGVR